MPIGLHLTAALLQEDLLLRSGPDARTGDRIGTSGEPPLCGEPRRRMIRPQGNMH
ncbi:MAG: hypothetical protein U0992_10515 [Planctomycetaceae bacterium]